MKHLFLSLTLTIVAVLAFALPARAQHVQWANGGIGVGKTTTSNYFLNNDANFYEFQNMNITNDGGGGVIVCWMSTYGSYYQIYAQRLDCQGNPSWTTSVAGLQLTNNIGAYPQAVGDGAGGAYISYTVTDQNTGYDAQYIQHVNATGTSLWNAGTGYDLTPGGEISSFPYSVPHMESDGNGGVVIAYYSADPNYGINYGTMRVARIKGTGSSPTFVWGPVALDSYNYGTQQYFCTNTQQDPVVTTDGNGGSIVAWQTQDVYGYYHIHVAGVNNAGSETYNYDENISTAPGMYGYSEPGVNGPADGSMGFHIVSDNNGGSIVSFVFQYYDPNYAQFTTWAFNVSNSGNLNWGPNEAVYPDYDQDYSHIASDGNGGFYMLYLNDWEWGINGAQYLQHVDNTGTMQYNPYGEPAGMYIANGNTTGAYAQVMNDGLGNAVCAWTDGSGNVVIQKYQQSDGSPMWTDGGSGGVTVSPTGTTSYPQTTDPYGYGWVQQGSTNDGWGNTEWGGPVITGDDAAGAFIAWDNTDATKIMVQHVTDPANAPQSQVTITTSPVNVGSTRAGKALLVNNVASIQDVAGVFPLHISSAASSVGVVTIANAMPIVLSNGQSTNVNVNVTPQSVGAFRDTLKVYSNDPNACPTLIAFKGIGIYPHIGGNASMDMGNCRDLVLTQHMYKILNTGTDTLHVTGASFATGDSVYFSIVGSPLRTIPPGGSDSIAVGFTPPDNKARVTELVINSDDSVRYDPTAQNPKIVTITGQGIYPHEIVTSNVLNFPYTVVNLRSSTKSVTIRNTGTDTLFLYNTSYFTGTNASEFSDTANSFPVAIPPGSNSNIKVTFNPKVTLGAKTAVFQLVSNYDSAGTPVPTFNYPITLNGTAVDSTPDFVYADNIDAGNIKVGTKDTVPFTLTNAADGTRSLSISQMTLQNSFAGTYNIIDMPSLPDTILIGKSQTLHLQFNASQAGVMPSNLHLVTNAAGQAIDIPVTGQGLKSFLSVAAVDFGYVGINKCATMPVKLTNFGTQTLKVTSLSLFGLYATSYSIADTANNLTLPAGASTTIDIMFCPTATGPQNIVAQFITDFPDTVKTTISGTGVFPGSLQSASVLDFGPVAIEQDISRSLLLRNIGQTPVTIIDQQINGAPPVPYTSSLVPPVVVAPGDSLAVTISFNSNTGGEKDATLHLTTSDSIGLDVALRAYASADPFTADPLLMFTDTIPGNSSQTQSTIVANFLKSPIQLTDLYITGPGQGAYRIMYPLFWPYPMQGQSIDSVSVLFLPNTGVKKAFPASLIIRLQNGDSTIIGLAGNASAPVDVRVGDAVPKAYDLSQNYPNPFGVSTDISFSIPDNGNVTLTVYDQLGRVVRNLVDGQRSAGTYKIAFNAEALPAGVYYYELRANGHVKGMSMQIVR